jgi:hypothetical protein
MNFLQLCRAVALDSGTVAGVPNFTTVTGATGRVAQVVGWTRDAYVDIQNERNDWLWMRQTFEEALTIGEAVYLPADLNLDDVGAWLPDIPALGWHNLSLYEVGSEDQEGELRQIPYMTFRERYQRGTHAAARPTEWAISPRGGLMFGAKPDKAYVVKGEYRMAPEELAADADVPTMPAAYHRVIVQEAMRLMARSDEAFQVLAEKSQQYDRLRNALVREQTPDISFGGGSFA